MPELPDLDWSDPDERAKLILAFSGVVGGGFFGYLALQSIKKGDLFWVEPEHPAPESTGRGVANFVVGALGLALFGSMVREALKEYGTKPLLYGSAAIGGSALLVKLVRG